MSRYDATQTNESTRSSKIFKDLNLDFQQNTATKDIQKITDVESVVFQQQEYSHNKNNRSLY